MEFRLELKPNHNGPQITITDKILLMGSCFTEHMFERFHHYKFNALQNPHGTLFNPHSILNSIKQYILNDTIYEDALFEQNALWNNWDFHSAISHPQKGMAISAMQEAVSRGHHFLKSAHWLIITFGSAFVYEYDQKIVANCHKVPSTKFKKYMLWPEDIIHEYSLLINELKTFNPTLSVLFTVSPVRHLKDGFIENNRSKASLLLAIERLTEKHSHCYYFPSYELLIDDLRDYRFYAEDMVHPNYLATRYIWEKFSSTAIDGKTREIFKEIDQIKSAMNHKIMHPGSMEHIKFIQKFKLITNELQTRFPLLDLVKEVEYFNSI